MRVIGDYHQDGYAHVEGLLPVGVTRSFMAELKAATGDRPIPLSRAGEPVNLLKRQAFEVYGYHFKPMLFFLWGLTPIVSDLVGRELLPTYDYLRIYREGDICRVHHDRQSCEHSLSLALDYSDGEVWPIEVEKQRTDPSARVEEDFGADAFSSISMQPGDALLYQGVHHRHGRVTPNPNGWSAHLFLHWVDADGPYKDHAFDGHGAPPPVSFSFS